MTRLEFTKFDNIEEMKKAFNALIKREEYFTTYTKDGETKSKKLCKNGRLYLDNNYSISLSVPEDGKCYLGVDYYSSDDRIEVNKKKPATEDVF